MEMPGLWVFLSTVAFVSAILALLVSLGAMGQILGKLLPLLTESRQQVQDLGDIATHTVSQASDTMEIVELRVSEAMGQATHAGVTASRQTVGVGSALAGLYLVSRVAGLMRQAEAKAKTRAKERGRKRSRRRERH